MGNNVKIKFNKDKTLSGNYGEMVEKKYMKLRKNVVYEDKNYKLTCNNLFYDLIFHKIKIKGNFILREKVKKTIIYGENLTSDENFINIHIDKINKLILKTREKNGQ